MGLDGLKLGGFVLLIFVAAACGGGGRPTRLLDGRRAAQFEAVPDGVIAAGRVLRRSELGERIESCLFPGDRSTVAADAPVVERVGVAGESLTFANRTDTGVFACDGGIDPAEERRPPWCGAVFGELADGRLLDPRLDILCRDREHRPLAYAFVDPVPGARWIGVRQNGYVELYEILAGLPVRIASTRGIRLDAARAGFDVTQYDAEGRALIREELEAAVAG